MDKSSAAAIDKGRYVKIGTFALKIIALAAMLLDHLEGTFPDTFPVALSWTGRIAIPVFMFCVIQGLLHTSNTRKYLFRLYIGSAVMAAGSFILQIIVSEARFQIADNMFATLFLLAVLISLIRTKLALKKKVRLWIIFIVTQMISFLLIIRLQTAAKSCAYLANGLIPNVITNQGSVLFLMLGLLMYAFRNNRLKFSVMYLAYCLLMLASAGFSGFTVQNLFYGNYQWMMIIALPLMLAYNGRRGRSLKYFFYAFYPLHIWLLFLIGNFVQRK
ncbi:TraX family protein [Desulfosporosinus sp. PR]|uniref:TraX family protein n=1 Tax=Candidatus Desulfosporosinus nitrosoreducens TaxID=3401928 RepID=UPI0027E63E33|nr:TraX family protein [Desulfosporosinus sp. PR]MDQ7095752.1 TraX family protein [Desulfosporosinus sp. PR]